MLVSFDVAVVRRGSVSLAALVEIVHFDEKRKDQ
jgi:hypothetical protein